MENFDKINLRKEFETESEYHLYYWFQEYAGAKEEKHGFSEEYVEWLEDKVKQLVYLRNKATKTDSV